MLVLIATECKIFFRDSQEKNAKKVEITEFYYQQNNQHVFNIGFKISCPPVVVAAQVVYSE
jgi:hypothetical protein